MTSKKWRLRIKKLCTEVGTYRPSFDPAISTLSDLLEQRDKVYQQYVDEGAEPLVVHTQDRGAQNLRKNPLLEVWDDLNKTALTYWRDLGLTPKGLKAIDEASMKPKKQSKLDKVMGELLG